MTNTTSPATPDYEAMARDLLARAEYMAEQNDSDVQHGDWSDAASGRRLSALYRRASAWRCLPVARGRTFALACSVEGPDADVWGHVASELLDFVGQDLPDTARIDDVGEGKAVLSW